MTRWGTARQPSWHGNTTSYVTSPSSWNCSRFVLVILSQLWLKKTFSLQNLYQQLMIHVPTRIFAWLAFVTNVFYSGLNYTCFYLVCNRGLMLDTTKSLFSILMRPIIKFVCLMIVYHKLYNDNVLNYVCPCYV